ncbi:MAG: M20/M25/M40 family metallo-hydrolase [Chloroflexota bacterium]
MPDSVEATVSFRYETLADGIATREKIEHIILEPCFSNDELGISDSAVLHLDTFIPPMERTDESQNLVDIVLDEAKALDLPVVPIARGGGSDANHVSGSGVPSICGMGAPAHGIHTNEERIYLPMLFKRVGLLARTCHRVLTEQP